MKKLITIVILIVITTATWWFFIGGRTLSEARVNSFYQDIETAILEKDADTLCGKLATDFQGSGTLLFGEQQRSDQLNKTQACEDLTELQRTYDMLNKKMGGMLAVSHTHMIHRISLSPDKRTATVEITHTLNVGGNLLSVNAHSTDTLIRKNGKTLLLKTMGEVTGNSSLQ